MKAIIFCILIAFTVECRADIPAREALKLLSFTMQGDVEMYLYLAPNGGLVASPEKFKTVYFTYLCSRIITDPVFELRLPKGRCGGHIKKITYKDPNDDFLHN